MHFLRVLLTLTFSFVSFTSAGKILIFPADYGFNSRLMNLGKMGDILSQKGHEVHMLFNSILVQRFNYKPPSSVHSIIYKMSEGNGATFINDQHHMDEFKRLVAEPLGFMTLAKMWVDLEIPYCEAIISDNKAILRQLKDANYSLVISDCLSSCSRLMIDYLDVPSIVYNNFGFIPMSDIFFPSIASFVCDPAMAVCDNDHMDFSTRVKVFIARYIGMYITVNEGTSRMNALREKYNLNSSLTVFDSFKRSLVLVRVHFAIDYPRPMMPNVIPIAGMFKEEPKPLSPSLDGIINSPEYDKLVVVSFGTLLPKIDHDKAELMARVLAKLPAHVIWRYNGPSLKSLGENTHLVGWFPQQDVLGHNKTRLFVTHCGISSTFEAIFHSVPVVAVPFLVDQPYNAEKLVGRAKMGRKVNIETLTEEDFSEAVFDVFYNDKYLRNAKSTRDELLDQELDPKDKLNYWVNHVMKFGTKKLISEAAQSLNIFQFYSVDVVLFFTGIFTGLFIILLCFCIAVKSIMKKCYSVLVHGKKKQQ